MFRWLGLIFGELNMFELLKFDVNLKFVIFSNSKIF